MVAGRALDGELGGCASLASAAVRADLVLGIASCRGMEVVTGVVGEIWAQIQAVWAPGR